MAHGPGKYDDLSVQALKQAGAIAAIVIIVGGKHGSGFSVNAVDDGAGRAVLGGLPTLLRQLADDIDGLMPKGHA